MAIVFAGCRKTVKTDDENVLDACEDFCLYVDVENIDQTIPLIDVFLASLSNDLTNEQKLNELIECLKSQPCINDVTVLCQSCIETDPPTSEIAVSFDKEGITKKIVLCISMGYPLKTACYNPEPLSDEIISFNLSESGKIDPELLIGEWEAIKFAYTADGNKISDVVEITDGWLTIPVATTPIVDDGTGQWVLCVVNAIMYSSSIEGNFIELLRKGSTYVYVVSPHLEYDLEYAFDNAYSFVIKGNELIIYFRKTEDKEILSHCTVIKNKNLLILKKNDKT